MHIIWASIKIHFPIWTVIMPVFMKETILILWVALIACQLLSLFHGNTPPSLSILTPLHSSSSSVHQSVQSCTHHFHILTFHILHHCDNMPDVNAKDRRFSSAHRSRGVNPYDSDPWFWANDEAEHGGSTCGRGHWWWTRSRKEEPSSYASSDLHLRANPFFFFFYWK